jgi:integrase
MARKTLTDKGVASLKARLKLYAHPDPQLPGHYVRVHPSSNKSYVAVARDPSGKQIWTTIGNTSLLDIDAARAKAREIIQAVKAGEDRAGPQSYQAVAEEWFKRHVETKGLRSAHEIRRLLAKHILPAWSGRDFRSIKRGDVAMLLDQVEDNSGARSADLVLSIISGIANWYAKRNDDYVSPVIRGMKRHSTKDHARQRILSDDEIRALWNAAEDTYGDILKMLLLTGQRRDKVADMRWDDVSIDGVWHVPNGSREKGAGGTLVLSPMAVDIIRARPRLGTNPYVFAGRGNGRFTIWRNKLALDAKLTGMAPWVLHDLRRTARSLMSRAGVRPDIAERVLGHAIRGVEGVYDRHEYREEKANALRLLASLIENILKIEGREDAEARA